jgi:mRNA interferase MazF
VVIEQSEVWWADLDEPTGSEPGYRRPVVVVQCNAIKRSRIGTVICVPLTSHLRWADAPWNVLLPKAETGLPRDSVANVSPVVALDMHVLADCVRKIPRRRLDLILAGIDIILGR